MRIIKNNSEKEIKVKCKCCKSKLAIKIKEFHLGMFDRRFIECPICKKDIWID